MTLRRKYLATAKAVLAIASVSLYSAWAEPSVGQQLPASILGVKSSKPAPVAFKASPIVLSLSKNRRNFASTPPKDLAAELENAKLPPSSGKLYAFPDLSKANFLVFPKVQPSDFHSSIIPGLDKTKIRRAKRPGFTTAQ